MAILDSFGRPAYRERKFAKAAVRGVNKPWERLHIEDIDDLIPNSDWWTILSASRKLFANHGICKATVLQKANYAVGRGWNPVYRGEDKDWGDQASKWLMNEFYPICDVRGPTFDFKTNLFIDSVAVSRDGDFFILLTESKTGYPQFQRIGAHRIGQRKNHKTVQEGKYKNLKIKKGVIFNKLGRAVAYRVLGEDKTGREDKDISAQNLIHVFDPHWHEQGRGIPEGLHAIDNILSSMKSEEYELMSQLAVSSIALVEQNESGMPDDGDPRTFLTDNGATNQDGFTSEVFEGGLVRYFKSGTGGGISTVNHDRPGNMWESFQDRTARLYITGANWSYSFVWKPNELTGTSNRLEMSKVKKSVEDRQDVLKGPARRMVVYAIAKAIKLGILPPNDNWWNWGFTMPPKISIDPGRDAKARIDQWKAGMINQTQICAENGRTYDEHILERLYEVATKKRLKEKVEVETGIKIDDREISMLTPNEQPDPKEEEENVS
jgi:capsid protein